MSWFIVDFDIPYDDKSNDSKARHMRFYRGLWKILKAFKIETSKRSTKSVWVSDSQEIAGRIHEWAKQFGTSHMYRGEELG